MRGIKKIAIIPFLILLSFTANAQVVISLLFGDKLNSEKIEFGLIGGINQSYFLDIEESKGLNNFNLGFYFHFNLKASSYISTGVLVKSNVGARGMAVYEIGDPAFDSVFVDAELTSKINYFYVPILFHQRIQNRFYVEGGFQVGLRGKANDTFAKESYDGTIEYIRNVGDQYVWLDAGLQGGIGYKFKKQTKSMSIGASYYYGLVNVSKDPNLKIANSSLYLFVKIPIGVKKSKKEG